MGVKNEGGKVRVRVMGCGGVREAGGRREGEALAHTVCRKVPGKFSAGHGVGVHRERARAARLLEARSLSARPGISTLTSLMSSAGLPEHSMDGMTEWDDRAGRGLRHDDQGEDDDGEEGDGDVVDGDVDEDGDEDGDENGDVGWS